MAKPIHSENVAFRITSGKGFQLTFPNGYTVSVQFGPGNYCSAKTGASFADELAYLEGKKSEAVSTTAEVLVWDKDGRDCGPAVGWQTATQVAAIIAETAARP